MCVCVCLYVRACACACVCARARACGGGMVLVKSSPSISTAVPKVHYAPEGKQVSRRAPAAWQCCRGRGGVEFATSLLYHFQ